MTVAGWAHTADITPKDGGWPSQAHPMKSQSEATDNSIGRPQRSISRLPNSCVIDCFHPNECAHRMWLFHTDSCRLLPVSAEPGLALTRQQ